jgi:glycosyltransferase involved in cell wall biosynthesis
MSHRHPHNIESLKPVALAALPSRPLMSVVITNYNYAEYVGRAIESVQAQTYEHFEIIVVDDGSRDRSLAVIEGYAARDPRIVVVTKANGGMASSWNAAWPHVHGDVVCPLDADDTFHADKLQIVVDTLQAEPASGLLIHAMSVVDREDREIQRLPFLTRFERGWLAEPVLRRGGRWRYMPTSALCFRREMGKYIFPVPEQTFRMHADALVVTLLPLLTRVSAVDRALTGYRVHDSNSLGGGARDRVTAEKVVKFDTFTAAGVNTRLAELGLPVRLDLDRNLEFLQALFILALFDGHPTSQVIRSYMTLASALCRDDLYRPSQKLAGLVVYGVAVLLPAAPRSWWIGQTLGYSWVKYAAQRVIRTMKDWLRRPFAVAPALPQGGAAIIAAARTGA